jgi:hypothetical protein
MKSGSFKKYFWLGAILTLSLNVVCCHATSWEDSPGEKSGRKAVAGTLEASGDPYWKYYEDCDRWGIDFTRANLLSTTKSHPASEKNELGKSLRREANIAFRTVKHVIPKIPVADKNSTQTNSRFTELISAWSQLKRSASKNFEQQVLPSIRFMEFLSVESATYPDFFLFQQQNSAQQGLEQLWNLAKAQSGLDRVVGDWIAKHHFAILLGKLAVGGINKVLPRVLQKSTSPLVSFSPTLKN